MAAQPLTVPTIWIQGLWDQEDMWGAIHSYLAVEPKDKANDYCILVGVFIHWQAESDKKIYDFNYQAVKESIQRALAGKPSVDEVLAKYKSARHPFAGGAEG